MDRFKEEANEYIWSKHFKKIGGEKMQFLKLDLNEFLNEISKIFIVLFDCVRFHENS